MLDVVSAVAKAFPTVILWTLGAITCVILAPVALWFAHYFWPPTAWKLLRHNASPFGGIARLVQAFRGTDVAQAEAIVHVHRQKLDELEGRLIDLEMGHERVATAVEALYSGHTHVGGFDESSH